MVIHGLRDCLLEVLRDYALRIGLLEHSNSVASSDTFALFQRRLRLNPFVVGTNEATTELRCDICCDTLMNESPSTAGDVRLLYDGSAIHERCHHRSKCQSEEQQNGVTTVD
uniref:Vacuolar sorting protein 39/Transforming growth factor beta receptor-associated domain-containing protein n=1 Tax=Globodera rostochiensis TaxID=31243 RepID=A0A914GWH2_GLORO